MGRPTLYGGRDLIGEFEASRPAVVKAENEKNRAAYLRYLETGDERHIGGQRNTKTAIYYRETIKKIISL